MINDVNNEPARRERRGGVGRGNRVTAARAEGATLTDASAGTSARLSRALPCRLSGRRLHARRLRSGVGHHGGALARIADAAHVFGGANLACDPAQVTELARTVIAQYGRLDILVNAAGMNVAPRSIADGTVEDWQRVLATNVTGAYLLTKAFLSTMRTQGHGTVINVVSDSGLRGNNFAGVAYIASKFGLRGLTEAINAEERQHGIRATSIYPGEVNTPILDRRPVPPSAEAREKMLQPEDVAECIALAATLPPRAVIEDLTVRPVVQDWVSRR